MIFFAVETGESSDNFVHFSDYQRPDLIQLGHRIDLILHLCRTNTLEEFLDQIDRKHSIGEKAKDCGEEDYTQIVEATHLTKHHKGIIDDTLLNDYFLGEIEFYCKCMLVGDRPLTYRFIKVEVIHLFRSCQRHEVYAVVIKLGAVLIKKDIEQVGLV